MAKTFASSTHLGLGGVDYSSQTAQCDLKADAAVLKATNFASGGWDENIGGIKKFTLMVKFVKDADLSGLDAIVFAALGGLVAFTLNRVAGANSASNPQYNGFVLITNWTPIAGQVGALFEASYTWDGSGVLNRVTV